MKILFLDVDGVLNSQESTRKSHHKKGSIIGIDPEYVLLLHRILEATDAKVVVSSTWRKGDMKEVIEAVKPFEVIGRTLSMPSRFRGHEVKAYLETRMDQPRYAILDDDSDFLWGQSLFKTTWEHGLTQGVVDEVIKHLNA